MIQVMHKGANKVPNDVVRSGCSRGIVINRRSRSNGSVEVEGMQQAIAVPSINIPINCGEVS